MKSTIVNRTVTIDGHKTSVTLEDQFWNALKEIARKRNSTVTNLIASIRPGRDHDNLSSAIRLFVLGVYRDEIIRRSSAKLIERLDIYRLPHGKAF